MATRLEEFRNKYPKYAETDADKLKQALHSKYYSDRDYDKFSARMDEDWDGATAPALKRPSTTGSGIGAFDAPKELGAGILEGTAAMFEGAGELERKGANVFLGAANKLFGTEWEVEGNRGEAFARPLRAGSEHLKESVSGEGRAAMEGATPRGNILKGEFDFGSDPSAGGILLQGANVLGQLAPALVGGAVTAGMRTAAQLAVMGGVTAAQTGGAALNEESERIRGLDQSELNRMPGYIDLIAQGVPLDEAREQLAVKTGQSAFSIAAPVGAGSGLILGAGLSKPVQNFMQRLVGQSMIARGATTALAEAPLEGMQEVSEGVAQRFGGSLATGEDRELGEGSAAEFGLGVLGGGIGGSLGAFQRPDSPDAAPPTPPVSEADLDSIEGREPPPPPGRGAVRSAIPGEPDGDGIIEGEFTEIPQPRLPPPGTEQPFAGEVDYGTEPAFARPDIQERPGVRAPVGNRLPPPGTEQEFTGEQEFPTRARGIPESELKISEVPQTDRYVAAEAEEKRLKAERKDLRTRNQEIQDQIFALPRDQQAALFDDESGEFSTNYDLIDANRKAVAAAEAETLAAQREAIAGLDKAKKQPGFDRPRPGVGKIAQEMEGTIPAPIDPQALDQASLGPAQQRKAVADMDNEEMAKEAVTLQKIKQGKPDPQNDDFLTWVAKSGGFNREAWAAEGVIDPANYKDSRAKRVVGKNLFPKEGGLTPDDLAERMLEGGFFPEQDPDAPLLTSANDTHQFVTEALSNREGTYLGPSAWKQARLDDLARGQDEVGQTSEDAQQFIDSKVTFEDAAAMDREIPTATDLDAQATGEPDAEIERQVLQAYEEISAPAPTAEQAASTATIRADLKGLKGDELTAEIRQLRDDELLARAGFDAPITDEKTGEFLDPHQARVAQAKVQREAGLEEDRRTVGLTDEQVEVMRANQARRQTVEKDLDSVFKGYFRRGERHKTALRALEWVKQTGKKAFYIEADIRNLGGLNKKLGTSQADVFLNTVGERMIAALDGLGAEKIIPIRRGGDEISFIVIGGDATALQGAIDAAEAAVAEDVDKAGMSDLVHAKDATLPKGVGILAALSEITKGAKIESIYSLADNAIEGRKTSDGQQNKTEATGTVAPGVQAEGTGDRAAQTAEGAGARTEPEQQPAPTLELETSDVKQPKAEPEPATQQQPAVQETLDAANVDQTRDIEDQIALDQAREPTPQPTQEGEAIIEEDELAELIAKLNEGMGKSTLRSGLDPELIVTAGRIGLFFVQRGFKNFNEWAEQMRAKLGNVLTYLQLRGVYNAMRDLMGIRGLQSASEVDEAFEKGKAARKQAMRDATKDLTQADEDLQGAKEGLTDQEKANIRRSVKAGRDSLVGEDGLTPFERDQAAKTQLVEGVTTFRSGMNEARDFEGTAAAGVPVGISLHRLAVDGKTWKAAIQYVKDGGKLFIDSGAFNAFTAGTSVDFEAVLDKYEQFLEGLTEEQAGRVSVVMPDVVGDQAQTLKLQEEFSGSMRLLSGHNGADVIIPVQLGAMSTGRVAKTIAGFMKGIKYRLGVPANLAALTAEHLSSLVRSGREQESVAGYHFLGIAKRVGKLKQFKKMIDAYHKGAVVSSDANMLRSDLTKISAKQGSIRESLAVEKSQEFDDTEVLEDASVWTPEQREAVLKTLRPEATLEGLNAAISESPDGIYDYIQAHAIDDNTAMWAVHQALMALSRPLVTGQARTDAITEVENERSTGEEGDLFQQPEAQGTPLSEITVEYETVDENGKDVTVTAPASEALAEVDQQIENIRAMRQCLLS